MHQCRSIIGYGGHQSYTHSEYLFIQSIYTGVEHRVCLTGSKTLCGEDLIHQSNYTRQDILKEDSSLIDNVGGGDEYISLVG